MKKKQKNIQIILISIGLSFNSNNVFLLPLYEGKLNLLQNQSTKKD